MNKVKELKKFKIHIIFVIFSVFGSCLVTAYSLYQIKQDELQILATQLYGPSPTVFVSSEEDSEIIENLNKIQNESYTVFYEINDVTRGYYFQGNSYIPPMIEGRFFEEKDFYNKKKKAVVGKNINESIIEEISNKGYEVIGVMGANYETDIDYLIYYNLDSLIDIDIESSPFVLVTDKDNEDTILTYIKNRTDNEISIIQRNEGGTFNFITDGSFQPFLLSIISIMLVAYSFTLAYLWFFNKNREIKILWFMGIHFSSVYKKNILTFILTFTVTYIFIPLLSYIYLSVNSQFRYIVLDHVNNMLISYILILIFSMMTFIYFYLTTTFKLRIGDYTL